MNAGEIAVLTALLFGIGILIGARIVIWYLTRYDK